MTKREVIKRVLDGGRPPYVPWSFSFTQEARERLVQHFGTADLEPVLHNHLLGLGNDIGFFDDIGNNRVRDGFGVVWNRTVDKDIGNIEEPPLTAPTLDSYAFPDPQADRFFSDIPEKIAAYGDRFRVFRIGWSVRIDASLPSEYDGLYPAMAGWFPTYRVPAAPFPVGRESVPTRATPPADAGVKPFRTGSR